LLIAAVDGGTGAPHLYQTCPSGNLYEFYASAIGARSQSARTYLEKHYESFAALPTDALVVHALTALQGCVSGDDDLTVKNASLVMVSKEGGVQMLDGDALKPYLDQLEPKKVEEDDDDDDNDDNEGETKTDEPVAMET
jgi:20S proteasome subunit alpha 6